MKRKVKELLDCLFEKHSLPKDEYLYLLQNNSESAREYAASLARATREQYYGKDVYIRGLIEISNYCRNDCFYCGIRRSNHECIRYRLSREEILECCEHGYELGFRTFVLQGGEDAFFADEFLVDLIKKIKKQYPDCAITLSLGECDRESYEALFEAGADRYLLRHETADAEHYAMLHPQELSYANRMKCLQDLKEIGYQTGCGFMVGSPFQTKEHLAKELVFVENFKPQMCGIGPFLSHHATPFSVYENGSYEDTIYLLSLIRLIHPKILLPSTTALGTIHENGREAGILAGANVVMPNLSPGQAKKKYELYDNKISDGAEAASGLEELKERMRQIGYRVVVNRGDICTE